MSCPQYDGGSLQGAEGGSRWVMENDNAEGQTMNRLLMFIGITVGGYVGWWGGGCLGFGLMGTFVVSSLGSAVGIYVVWRIMRDYLD